MSTKEKRRESKKKASLSKRASTSDMPSGRKNSSISNPFLLPDFDDETYEPLPQHLQGTGDGLGRQAATGRRKNSGVGVSFRKVAKAITQQRKWSSVLKVNILLAY